MFSNLLDRMGASSRSSSKHEITRAPSSESIDTSITVDDTSNLNSSTSTPPTSIGDNVSVTSATGKPEPIADEASIAPEHTDRRSQRARAKVGTYNAKILAGTAVHTPKKFLKDKSAPGNEARRQTISGGELADALGPASASAGTVGKNAQKLVSEGIDALDLSWSVKKLPKSASKINHQSPKSIAAKKDDLSRRKSLRSTPGEKADGSTKKISLLGKRDRKEMEGGLQKAKRELRNLADTKEFAKIETEPVVLEVWSNGKLVKKESARKKKKAEEAQSQVSEPEPTKTPAKKLAQGRKEKAWLTKGLYAGQDPANLDWFKSSGNTKSPFKWTGKPNKALPLPLWNGQRLLHVGRDFKLPFDICAPLPPGQPKPTEWYKTSHNRFIGEAGSMWKKSSLFDSFFSKCICKPDAGCDEDCQNRIMLYECDDTNCGAGRDSCTNRAFAELFNRRKGNSFRKGGNKYEIGVEVIKTADRCYGVRSNRCFNANQIIVEYTGEIITEDECDRRMNEDYKDNDCYYLMSFDQNMIIDATRGSIARFVNHSCRPNCRMVKWIVEGKPRMALFAGDNPIMTGDELTYDYNFDPFSAKNVQACRCGSDNCRGVLGPRPKDQKVIKATTIKDVVKAGLKAGKRKLQQMIGDDEDDEDAQIQKKRKTKTATGVKSSISTSTTNVAKTVKKTVSTQLSNARHVVGSSKKTINVSQATAGSLKTYGKKQMKLSSSSKNLTIVSPERSSKGKEMRRESVTKSIARSRRSTRRSSVFDDANESTIRVVTNFEGEEEEED
ncbi:hypothetical protein BOTNAR_0262g00030 [Botryotinia narcissicola]|uniref:Histone-lysine N-methyltransferase n=1 Tax=Botryotinia narcissicola TaxID=278944 RepID=A0A4Z1ID87_9HELO|nr:hypothetical protein BOTNAR_0262g00030 [Botryotinia narcissicola]